MRTRVKHPRMKVTSKFFLVLILLLLFLNRIKYKCQSITCLMIVSRLALITLLLFFLGTDEAEAGLGKYSLTRPRLGAMITQISF